MPQSSSTFINEYTLPDVVENSSSRASKMTIKEYKRIGEGAFGTVVEAMLKYETNRLKERWHWVTFTWPFPSS